MKYSVISPLEHDKKRYEPGDVVDLSEAAAAPLLGRVVEAAPEAAQEEQEDPKGKKSKR